MTERSGRMSWSRVATLVLVTLAASCIGWLMSSRADGPIGIFAGGPLRTGERVLWSELDWTRLDARPDLELEIVTAATSRTLWFSVHDGVPYVACDLDCMDGRLTRWPQQIERDDRVVIRIDGQRVEGRLVHVEHGTPEYAAARAGRERKYSEASGARAAAEAAAHNAVVEVGETLTGRARRSEPGDRLYRIEPR